MTCEEFDEVFTKDWHGKLGVYKIIRLVKRKRGQYSVTFINSEGDLETHLLGKPFLSYSKKIY
jgi:hypothetical protein